MLTRTKNLRRVCVALTLAGVLVISQWSRAGHALGDTRLIVWFFDVGQGDAIFIESPNGEQLLIDGGPGSVVLEKLSDVMPFWDRTIDRILLTHPHADHVDGLVEVVERYDVKTVYTTGVEYATSSELEFERRISDDQNVVIVNRSMTIDLGDGVTLKLITPTSSLEHERVDDVNDASIVGILRYGETSILLTGDIGNEAELQLIPFIDEPVDVLKVGHHGSRYSTSTALLQAIRPKVGVISAGEGNEYGHPHQEILERLASFGVSVLRTDQNGDVRLLSDGEEPWITAFSD
ncbi:MAG: MBL fold metallo-hydrolase [Patescibacteria group bacterium]